MEVPQPEIPVPKSRVVIYKLGDFVARAKNKEAKRQKKKRREASVV